MTEEEIAKEAVTRGTSLSSVGKLAGISGGTVRRILMKLGKYKEYLSKRKRHPKRKPDHKRDAEIIRRLLDGQTHNDIMRDMRVSNTLIIDAKYNSGRHEEIDAIRPARYKKELGQAPVLSVFKITDKWCCNRSNSVLM